MAARQNDVSKEALSRLPNLDIYELREEWGVSTRRMLRHILATSC
jgi:hypothetical protein